MRRGFSSDNVLSLVDEGMEILVDEEMDIGSIKATKSRSIQASKTPTIECLLGSFVIFQGIRTILLKKTYSPYLH